MKLAEISNEKLCLRKERQVAKRIEIESEPGFRFEVAIRSTAVKRGDVCKNDRPHPGPLPQEREKRSPLLPNNPRQDGADAFSISFKTSKGSSLSPGERVRVRASVKPFTQANTELLTGENVCVPLSQYALPAIKFRSAGLEARLYGRQGCLPPRFPRASLLLLGLWCLFTALTSSAAVRPERWRWSNPLPHGNNVLDMFVTTDLAAQVGDGGTIYVQRTDERWAPAVSGVTNYLRGVALMGERFIAVGESGCILWSDDGNYFQPAQLSPVTSDWFEGVTASTQRAVAVGDNGSIYTSTNGATWTKATSGTTEWLRGVAFGNGAYVAVGENGKILRSTGGTSWSPITSGTTAHLNRVRYVGTAASGQFIAVGNSGAAFSSVTGNAPWISLSSGSTNALYDIATNDTGLLLVGDQEVRFRAAGGATWTNQITALATNAPPAWMYLAAYGSSNSWLVAGRAGMLVSGSRTNATQNFSWQLSPDSSHAWLWDVTVQNGIYVAVGDLATIQTSLDGLLWAREVVPVPHTNTVLLGVGGNTNLLLAVGNLGNLLLSRAGLTTMAITNYHGTNIVVTNSTFETLGLIWTNLPAFTTNTLQGVAVTESLFIVAGESGKIFTSLDVTNWTPRATPTANFLSSVAIGPNACVAVGAQGTLLRSGADGAS